MSFFQGYFRKILSLGPMYRTSNFRSQDYSQKHFPFMTIFRKQKLFLRIENNLSDHIQ